MSSVQIKSIPVNDKPSIKSINPATLASLGEVSNLDDAAVIRAVASARAAQPAWAALGFSGRKKFLLAARDKILSSIDAIALLISEENGKPIAEAIGNDIMPVLDLMTYFAGQAEKILKKERLKLGKWTLMGRRSHLEYYPYGVIGVIAPWNFPFSIPMGEVAMALMAGNTVVLKPSEHTPLIGLKVQEVFDSIGLPKDVLKTVTGDGLTGAALIKARVDKIAFTGSVPTGKKIMAACAEHLIPVTLELGGKDPMLVFEDADLDVASSAAVWGAFCNSGQVCASVERVYVHHSIADEFTRQVVEKTKKLRQGNGQSADVDIGAMTMELQLKKVEAHVADAKKRGAKILVGGEREAQAKGWFFPPTVMTGVDHSFLVVKDETFGPVLPIMTFKTEEDAVHLANDSDYGLNAYIWTKDRARGERLASRMVAGTVTLNDSVFTFALPMTPWGGPKQSGLGRTHGALGLLDLVQVRHIHINTQAAKRNFFWWYSYSPEKIVMMKTLCLALFGKGFSRIAALLKFIGMSFKAKVL